MHFYLNKNTKKISTKSVQIKLQILVFFERLSVN